MNQVEFKDLNNVFVKTLEERCEKEDAEVRVLPTPPMSSDIKIAINYKGVRICDIYSLTNTGDYAQWRYEGKLNF